MTIEEAARDASLGRNDPLWNACWKIAQEQGWSTDPKISNQKMCELAIRAMPDEQRARFLRATS